MTRSVEDIIRGSILFNHAHIAMQNAQAYANSAMDMFPELTPQDAKLCVDGVPFIEVLRSKGIVVATDGEIFDFLIGEQGSEEGSTEAGEEATQVVNAEDPERGAVD